MHNDWIDCKVTVLLRIQQQEHKWNDNKETGAAWRVKDLAENLHKCEMYSQMSTNLI